MEFVCDLYILSLFLPLFLLLFIPSCVSSSPLYVRFLAAGERIESRMTVKVALLLGIVTMPELFKRST